MEAGEALGSPWEVARKDLRKTLEEPPGGPPRIRGGFECSQPCIFITLGCNHPKEGYHWDAHWDDHPNDFVHPNGTQNKRKINFKFEAVF